MSQTIEIKVPDIGSFKNVAVIEISVKAGDQVAKEQALVSLETDKATVDVPSPVAGVVKQIKIKVGDKVSEGSVILTLETQDLGTGNSDLAKPAAPAPQATAAAPTKSQIPNPVSSDLHAEVVVLGAGPGGYTAAFRAADLGKQVVLIEKESALGGVCLNVGCIPSKALLHVAKVITEAEEVGHHGVTFGKPKIDIDGIRAWKESVISKSTGGLAGLAKQRKVQVLSGKAQFSSPNSLSVQTADGVKTVTFDNAIVAAGSSVARIPGFPYDDPRMIDSTGALALKDIPKRMLVIGGGIIGLEMATVYDALGSKITVVELMDQLMPGADKDLVKPLHTRIAKRYESIMLKTKVTKIEATKAGLKVTFEGEQAPAEAQLYDKVLMAVGRRPNGREISAEAAGLTVNERGFIPVDKQMRTNVPHIFAIGDIVGDPMLAHKAVHEGKVAAENIAGHKAFFEPMTIPSVAYTDPEVAWMGLTETQAQAKGIAYEKASFPWMASGRAGSVGRPEGITKVLLDPTSRRILGMGIVGVNAGELIAEGVLALEMGADMEDIGLTIHPHPTLSETLCFAAEMAEGTITDLPNTKKK
ncbi:dihydrolipoyl dehydrogenase [mine drainage metagenome]|uniref:dihydrolipoyl dehydrogenase n=1 Tax=mine drainage metagenome TaxID=410659 RepID=A0A1J5U1H6_9ZZZZ